MPSHAQKRNEKQLVKAPAHVKTKQNPIFFEKVPDRLPAFCSQECLFWCF
jgi:hypothetical protein